MKSDERRKMFQKRLLGLDKEGEGILIITLLYILTHFNNFLTGLFRRF